MHSVGKPVGKMWKWLCDLRWCKWLWLLRIGSTEDWYHDIIFVFILINHVLFVCLINLFEQWTAMIHPPTIIRIPFAPLCMINHVFHKYIESSARLWIKEFIYRAIEKWHTRSINQYLLWITTQSAIEMYRQLSGQLLCFAKCMYIIVLVRCLIRSGRWCPPTFFCYHR